MNDIKITVLMPCYNAEAYIADAISSVLAQHFQDLELLIINDGSTYGTVDVIRSFSDKRIVLAEQPQLGIAAALNNGLQLARAAYIARFDADDICFPDRLQQQYDIMQADPELVVVGSGADYMDASGQHVFTHKPSALTDAAIKELPYYHCPFIHASVMFRKEKVKAVGYDVNAHSFEDHLLWQKLKSSGKMYNIPRALLKVRLNPSSITMDERKRPAGFHRIKLKALSTSSISKEQGEELLSLISRQNGSDRKKGAYYSLLAKKFLWNNYDPLKARSNLKKAIILDPYDIKDHVLYLISYLPEKIINRIYSIASSK